MIETESVTVNVAVDNSEPLSARPASDPNWPTPPRPTHPRHHNSATRLDSLAYVSPNIVAGPRVILCNGCGRESLTISVQSKFSVASSRLARAPWRRRCEAPSSSSCSVEGGVGPIRAEWLTLDRALLSGVRGQGRCPARKLENDQTRTARSKMVSHLAGDA